MKRNKHPPTLERKIQYDAYCTVIWKALHRIFSKPVTTAAPYKFLSKDIVFFPANILSEMSKRKPICSHCF